MSHRNRGFTLVEIMLAMAFIAFLLLFIISAILQITRLYSKGMAIRQINQTGRQVMEQLTRDVRYATPTFKSSNNRLCVNGVTYVWNTSASTANKYASPATGEINFISLSDSKGVYCNNPTLDIPKDQARNLLGPEVRMYGFSLGKQGKLWNISMLLGTSGGNSPDISVASGKTTLSCPADNQFCAFGDFDTSVYSRRERL